MNIIILNDENSNKTKMYQRGKIYNIRSYHTDKVYIGSTVQPLCKRMGEHRKDYKNYLKGMHTFVSSFTMLDYEDAYIELYENYSCNSKEELCKREGEIIRKLGESCVNMVIPGRTKKEYNEDNQEKIKEKAKKYYEKNKDKIYQRNKKYCEKNSEKIKQYLEKNKEIIKEKAKKYREDNKEKLKEVSKTYYENNKDKVKERAREKIECSCGLFIRKDNLSNHKKTKKHQNLEEINY